MGNTWPILKPYINLYFSDCSRFGECIIERIEKKEPEVQ